jgi:hypothetical protein
MTRPNVTMISRRDAAIFDSRPARDWLNPISMSKLQIAVNSKAKVVELNGREFSIEYGVMWQSKVLSMWYECICLRRTDGELVPFGYVSVKRIKDFIFEGDGE